MTTRLDIDRTDIVIVGAGILGASLAYFLARSGVYPLVLDRVGPAAEASGANAGMIGASGGSPGTTLPLSLLSAKLYDQASSELDEPIHFHRSGRLLLAHSASDLAERETYARERQRLGLNVEMLYGDEVREIEPILSDKVVGAAYAPDDGKIDPIRATVAYLNTACRLGARFEPGVEVESLIVSGGAVRGVVVNGQRVAAERVVLAAGAWSGIIAETAGIKLPVVPGRGQMLVTAPVQPVTPRVLRAVVIGMRQMDEGNVVIGSEVEFVGYDKEVAPMTLARYCRLIKDTIPALAEVTVQRVWAGVRPMTPDNLPIVGGVRGLAGLDLLTGHGRSGMTFGPASALALAEIILHGKTAIPIEPFSLDRFSD